MRTVFPFLSLKQTAIYGLAALTALFFLLPFMLFGENSIITIHDNLDSLIPWFKMYRDNGLFFKFNVPSKGFSEMSTLYYFQVGYTFQSLLYMLFDDFTAYTLSFYCSAAFGFFSMYILLKKALGFPRVIGVFMSVCYAFLPVYPNYNIAAASLPLLIAVFFYFASQRNTAFLWKSLLLLFYPFFSFFGAFGFFILGFWFLGLIVLTIKNKRINPNLLAGFILLCMGYILTDLQMFYAVFVLKTPLNRDVFADTLYPADVMNQIKTFLRSLKSYGVNDGYYGVVTFQKKFIVPAAFFVSLAFLIKLFFTGGKEKRSIKTILAKADDRIKFFFLLELLIAALCIIAALHDSGLAAGFIKRYVPVLSGLNWARAAVFNRVLWYVIFGICLQVILNIKTVRIILNDKEYRFGSGFSKLIAGALICLQIGYIALSPGLYNDQVRTWINEIEVKRRIVRNIIPQRKWRSLRNFIDDLGGGVYEGDYSFISYKEFFAKDLFDRIKKDISYSGERVVALGYHPSVLMYNGFNCIDGYNSAYPLSYMRSFRTLIAPEFEINQDAREYYDKWGGRMYLYNSELNYGPTKGKDNAPVKLNINTDVFRNTFNGSYILSRSEISNSGALGLALVKRYYDKESIYTIYLYALEQNLARQVPR
jgi:hypothetical protein